MTTVSRLASKPKSLRETPTPRDRRAKVSATVVTLGIVSLLTDISSESVASILPLYVTSALGLTTVAYGFIDGLMQGASALVRIAGGWAADRGDHPKWVAAVGYGLSALTRGVLLVTTSFGALVAVVGLDRIGKGIRTSPRDAMISAASDPRTIGRSFGVHRALDTLGAALGPLVASVVLWMIADGYSTVFTISFALALLGVAAIVLLVPDLRPRNAAWLERHRTRETRGLPRCKSCACDAPGLKAVGRPFSWSFLRDRSMRRLLIVTGVLGLLTVGDGFVYLSLQARDGFATQWFPMLYVGTNAVFMALAVPLGAVADRIGRLRVFLIGHLALLGAYLCAGATTGATWTTLASLALLGLFYAATDGVLAALVGSMADSSVRATAIGTVQTVLAVARMAASAAFGVLWYALGRSHAVLVVAGLLLVAVVVAWVVMRGADKGAVRRERLTRSGADA